MKPRIIFFGSSDFAAPVVDTLKKNLSLVGSVTSSEQKIEIEDLKKLNPDLFVVASFGKILKKEILKVPKYGSVNIHPSLLPKYRGASPVQLVILNGERKTGVSIIKMDEEVDHGPILFQKKEVIQGDDTFEVLAKRLFKIAADNLYQIIKQYIKGDLKPVTQNHSKATFTKLLSRNDGFIDINNPPSAQKIKRMIRAFYPWPGVFFKYNFDNKEKIIKLLPQNKIQVEGKNPMSYKDFINGYSQGKEILKKIGLISN